MIYLTPEPDVPQIIFEETVPGSINLMETKKMAVGPNSFQKLQYPLHLPGSIEEVPRSISPGDPFIQPLLTDSTPVENSNGEKIVAALQSQRTLKRTGRSKAITY